MVTRSLSPLPPRTTIWLEAKSTSWDPQPAALEYAKTRAVEQARHEPRRPIEPPERRAHLVTREDDWQPLGPPGAHDLVQPRQLHAQQRDRHGPHRQRRAAACRDPLV